MVGIDMGSSDFRGKRMNYVCSAIKLLSPHLCIGGRPQIRAARSGYAQSAYRRTLILEYFEAMSEYEIGAKEKY